MSHIRRAVLAAAILVVACDRNPTERTPLSIEDQFSTSSLSAYSAHDLSGTTGVWRITGGRLIGEGPANQNVLIRNGLTLTDGYVEADLDRADDAGLVFRFQDARNYYLLAIRDDSASLSDFQVDNLGFYVATNGEFEWLAVGSVEWPRGLGRVRVEFQGPAIRVYFNGTYLGSVSDSRYPSGGVGVRHMLHPSAPHSVNSYDRFAAGEL